MLVPSWYPFNPHLATRELVRTLEPELSLLCHWRRRIPEWREQLRARLAELLVLSRDRSPLHPRELDRTECDGYTRLRLVYNAEPGVSVPAWLCVPFNNETPLPAIICTHDRGPGKDEIVGLVGDASSESHVPFAADLARRGYVTLAPDARGFGERRDNEAGLQATGLLLGRPLVADQIWDLLRALDYLADRPDVRATRIGITGAGMGGFHALLAAAADERLACTAVCGGFTTFRELIVARDCFSTCPAPADILPGLLRYADLDDLACLIAPRALMLVHSRQDTAVPLRGAEDCIERVRAGFALQGEQVRLETVLEDGPARYRADPAYRFLDDWLKLP